MTFEVDSDTFLGINYFTWAKIRGSLPFRELKMRPNLVLFKGFLFMENLMVPISKSIKFNKNLIF